MKSNEKKIFCYKFPSGGSISRVSVQANEDCNNKYSIDSATFSGVSILEKSNSPGIESHKGVSVAPGLKTQTFIPLGRHSSTIALDIPSNPALAAQYAEEPGKPVTAQMEET